MTHIPLPPDAFDPPRARRHIGLGAFIAAVTVTAMVALTVAAVPVFLLKPGPSPAPGARGIVAAQGPLRFVPDPGPSRRATAAEISRFLHGFYAEVFLPPRVEPTTTPTPQPAARLARFFTARARAALNAHPDVFTPDGRVSIDNGRVSFDGLVTMSGRRPAQAFLSLAFTGRGSVRRTPVVVSQKGSVLLLRSEQGWLIGGFDLKLAEASVTPSPSPTR